MIGAWSYIYSRGSNAAERLHQVQKLAILNIRDPYISKRHTLKEWAFEKLIISWLTKVWLHTFFVTNKVKWRIHCCKKCTLHYTCQGEQWKYAFEILLIFWVTKVWLCTFFVTNQVKRQIHRCKKCTLHITCQGKNSNTSKLAIFGALKITRIANLGAT